MEKSYKIRKYTLSMVRDGSVSLPEKPIGDFAGARAVLWEYLQGSPVERVCVLHLNGRNRVIGIEVVAQGGLHGCALGPRDILRGAIVACASAIIIGHNHPSGDPTPSPEDIQMTQNLNAACEAVGMPLLDHVIVAESGATSLIEVMGKF